MRGSFTIRARWLTALLLAILGAGCCHTSDQERMDELLYQSEDFGPPRDAGKEIQQWLPAGDLEPKRGEPERIQGGII